MWLEKFLLMYMLTLFNSLDGYFLDNQLQNTGRHRRKGMYTIRVYSKERNKQKQAVNQTYLKLF